MFLCLLGVEGLLLGCFCFKVCLGFFHVVFEVFMDALCVLVRSLLCVCCGL